MMKRFLDEDFLLSTETAKKLYHGYAEDMPIIDFHCHIDPRDIADDVKYPNIARLLLGRGSFGDHYKWRLMRSDGVEEEKITGGARDYDRFLAFASTLPKAIGNPVFHWTHLELKRYFGFDGVLSGDTAREVWERCNEVLKSLSVREIIYKSKVELIATTDDPADSLESHKKIMADSGCRVRVVPSWRPDRAVNLEKEGYASYIELLSKASGTRIFSFDSLKKALVNRLDYFGTLACRGSDHGLDVIPGAGTERTDPDDVFNRALAGVHITRDEIMCFKFHILRFLAGEYEKRGWVMQLHFGALRNVNSKGYSDLGPDTGFDCVGNQGDVALLARFLDTLDADGALPRTVLYSSNGCDNSKLVSLINCFQKQGTAGKLQHGSAWWFNDTKSGIVEQLTALAEGGLLGNFVGMLTDSRSFLSYIRHEYFRRILCDLIGRWAENGEYPCDIAALGKTVRDISYYNSKRYFNY